MKKCNNTAKIERLTSLGLCILELDMYTVHVGMARCDVIFIILLFTSSSSSSLVIFKGLYSLSRR